MAHAAAARHLGYDLTAVASRTPERAAKLAETFGSTAVTYADLPGQADIVVAAVGKRNVLTADMVKPGAVIIDVGMNRDDAGKLCGDVDFAGVKEVAGWITPVPGGVGPMTRAMLLVNTIEAAERAAT